LSTLPALYRDEATGKPIATHSMLKTFRRCPKQTEYKYFIRLKPRVLGKPLRQGSWMHRLQEVYYKGGDWEAEHKHLSYKFNELFDEEKDEIGDLPTECLHMMKSYLWHYKKDQWKVHDVEFVLETEFPDGTIYRAKIDLLVEDQYGLWLVDHKWHRSLPNLQYRILDSQSGLYVWAARQNKLKVQGHIWNYGVRKAPGIPDLLKDGTRLSNRKLDTDYPTLLRAIKAYGLDPERYRDKLLYLKRQQYQFGTPQTSSFFRRNILEMNPEMLKQTAREAYHTARRMNEYNFEKTEFVERVPDRSCTFMCSYPEICSLELFGGNTANIRRERYKIADPMEYYEDDPRDAESEI
jgi:PD-(D/E)XK nuclease superfamily